MTSFFKSIVRGFRQTSNSVHPPKSFLGNFMQNMAETEEKEEVLKPQPYSYFTEPLAGDLSCFYSTKKEDIENSEPKTSDILEKTELQSQKCSVPFMITRNMKLDLLDKGYKMEDIKKMTPAEAHEILKMK